VSKNRNRSRLLTSKQFDRMVRLYKHKEILWRVQDIENWVAEIKATPDDIRNTPDLRPDGKGGTFSSDSDPTNLDLTLKHCEAVRQKFLAGKLDLARFSLDDLEHTVLEINNRITAPLIATGKKSRDASKRGVISRQNPARDKQMAREFLERKESDRSHSALMEDIGKNRGFPPLRSFPSSILHPQC
jgi:hypothetical protein